MLPGLDSGVLKHVHFDPSHSIVSGPHMENVGTMERLKMDQV